MCLFVCLLFFLSLSLPLTLSPSGSLFLLLSFSVKKKHTLIRSSSMPPAVVTSTSTCGRGRGQDGVQLVAALVMSFLLGIRTRIYLPAFLRLIPSLNLTHTQISPSSVHSLSLLLSPPSSSPFLKCIFLLFFRLALPQSLSLAPSCAARGNEWSHAGRWI